MYFISIGDWENNIGEMGDGYKIGERRRRRGEKGIKKMDTERHVWEAIQKKYKILGTILAS